MHAKGQFGEPPLWAITAYFNPMRWRRRLHNYRLFRQHLTVPLVTVELGYGGQFDLAAADADILLQLPGSDIMWQKERLLNLALAAVPPDVDLVACLDGDVIFPRQDVWRHAARALERAPLVQLFSHACYLPADHPLDSAGIECAGVPAPGFAWLRERGEVAAAACHPVWPPRLVQPPVVFGLGWAFRRGLFSARGFYDAWIIGGGMRMYCLAGDGRWEQAASAMHFHAAMRDHFGRWAESFQAELKGRWACVPGTVTHLWHGELADRKYRQRYEDFARFLFDPTADIARSESGCWRWSSAKPVMHQFVRDYFAARREDGAAPGPPAKAA